jgi:S1-C subfamily serine protease
LICLFILFPIRFKIESDSVRQGTPIAIIDIPSADYTDENVFEDKEAEYVRILSQQTVKVLDVVYVDSMLSGPDKHEGSGSGVVIAVDVDSNNSLVLTNDHVCDTVTVNQWVNPFVRVTKVKRYVVTTKNKKLKMKVLFTNKEADLCIIETDGIAGEPALISSFYPPEGAKVITIGSPKGAWANGLANVVEGRFIGIRTDVLKIDTSRFKDFLQYSIPIVAGMSGSAVYYRGQLIGLINSSNTAYEHLGWGPGLKHIVPFVKQSLDKWNDMRKEE